MPVGEWIGRQMLEGRRPVDPFGEPADAGQVGVRLLRLPNGEVLVAVSAISRPGVHATAWIKLSEWQKLAGRVNSRLGESR
ncbi:hypothetical protein [Catenuloplanes atrovinosus]|uniref:Uncharacterized protein n=1 Tax=Catenuloplanes atrovinosus TaxID=137266 RepID=A0AAE3YUP9_9ACTN|nr:hypothetical protein [Catenuloplanes atrovinosus]MDR7278950.1 hypothetical protein [Catenuloplanes atrovinosus]